MVKALIDISNAANRVLMIVKAEYGLKDKSQAINVMAKEYEELVFEPKVKASYLKKLERIRKGGTIKVGTIDDFNRMYNLTSKK
jgi:Protein of unknown function (DUF2683)